VTLILTLGNSRQVIQLSDRRLSSAGSSVAEHFNKATVFVCVNGRLAVGFTGLATVGGFSMQRWLVEALERCAPPEFGISETVERLRLELSALFRTDRRIASLAPAQRRLSIMLSGYLHNRSPGEIGCLVVTNFQDFESGDDFSEARDEFWSVLWLENENAVGTTTHIQRVGAWPAMTSGDESILRELLARDAPEAAIIDAGVGLMRSMADRREAHGTIGKEIQATVIPRDPAREVSTRLRNSEVLETLVLTDQVLALPGGSFAIRDVQIAVHDGGSIPPRLSRNERCWCNSGEKYKRCHGRQR